MDEFIILFSLVLYFSYINSFVLYTYEFSCDPVYDFLAIFCAWQNWVLSW